MKPDPERYTALSDRVEELRKRHRQLHDKPPPGEAFDAAKKQLRGDLLHTIAALRGMADGGNRYQVLLDQSAALITTLDRLVPRTKPRTASERASTSVTGRNTSGQSPRAPHRTSKTRHATKPEKPQAAKKPKKPRAAKKLIGAERLVAEILMELSWPLSYEPLHVVGIDKATGKKIVRLVDTGPDIPVERSKKRPRRKTASTSTSVWTVSGGLPGFGRHR